MKFRNDHDLSFGAAGPWSKRMLGASLITDRAAGGLVHFPVSAGLAGADAVPAAPGPEGERRWIMAEADSGMTLFTQRIFLRDDRSAWCDATHVPLGGEGLVSSLRFVNRGAAGERARAAQGLLHEFDAPAVELSLPPGSVLIEAEKPHKLESYHRYGADGEAECVRRMLFASGERALEGRFGEWPGDRAEYRFTLRKALAEGFLYIRYAKPHDNSQAWRLTLGGRSRIVRFVKTTDHYGLFSGWKYLEVPLGRLKKGLHRLSLEVLEPQNRFFKKQYERNLYSFPSGKDVEKGTALALDFLLLCEGRSDSPGFVKRAALPEHPFRYTAEGPCAIVEDALLRANRWFAFGALEAGTAFRTEEPAYFFREVTEHHYRLPVAAGPSTLPEDAVSTPCLWMDMPEMDLPAGSEREWVTVAVRAHGRAEALMKWREAARSARESLARARDSHAKRRFTAFDRDIGPSISHMVNYTVTNISFPNFIINRHVLGVCPGKFHFNMLYQWDAGMTAVAQAQTAGQLAVDNILQYSTEGDPARGFIQHGTALPTHIYALWELFQHTGDRRTLARLYGPMRHAYLFYTGRHPASTTLRNRDGFINPTNIWYNCLGMDDYPVQQHLAQNNLLTHAAMPETNASAVRFARILRLCAFILGREKEIPGYGEDIRRLSKPLNRLWDGKSGYYLWLERGKPVLHESGENFNKGLSGVYPLICGLDDPAKTQRLLSHLKSPEELWSPIGISTVDQSAPYYSPDGYWNGRVWIAHQWVIWKALLSMGEAAFAEKVARTALAAFSNAEKKHAMCFENFIIKSGEGAGAVHFSALSAPVVNFYCAYFRPGQVTLGFDSFLKRTANEGEAVKLFIESPFMPGHTETVVVVLKPMTRYLVNGKEMISTESGSLSINIEIDKKASVSIAEP